jgi:adenine-specific DNA methylase
MAPATAPPVHPFPARMASEIALRRLPRARVAAPKKVILDPMMGSGTIPVMAALRGHLATGFDLDPLALLIARTWGRPLSVGRYLAAADAIAASASEDKVSRFEGDEETARFVAYWFDEVTQQKLAALAQQIRQAPKDLRTPLWCAFSRLIITKDASVSLARDVSHSRPHRVRDVASVDAISRFPSAARDVARRHGLLGETRPAVSTLQLRRADARELPVEDQSIDLTMTSPPYLNAIDYLRGHRMSLVWMGHRLAALRALRADAIGSERGHWDEADLIAAMRGVVPRSATSRAKALVRRYALDLDAVLAEQARVLRRDGRLTLVVADGTVGGSPVRVARLCVQLAAQRGFRVTSRRVRELPASRRYLPPPLAGSDGHLHRRMRAETAVTFALR